MASRVRSYIELSERLVRPGSGSSRAFLDRRTWGNVAMRLFNFALLRAPYVVVGGLATALYMPERLTRDVDVLTTPEHYTQLASDLRGAYCRRLGELGIGVWLWETAEGIEFDVLVSDEAWAREAVARPNRAPDGTPVVALPYLALMKLRAGRAQDVADLARMLGGADTDTWAAVVATLERFGDAEMAENAARLRALGALEYE